MNKRLMGVANGIYEQAKRQTCETMFLWFVLAMVATPGIGLKRLLACLDQFGLIVDNCADDWHNLDTVRKMVEDQTGIHCKFTSKGVAYYVEEDKKDLYGDYFIPLEEENQ